MELIGEREFLDAMALDLEDDDPSLTFAMLGVDEDAIVAEANEHIGVMLDLLGRGAEPRDMLRGAWLGAFVLGARVMKRRMEG